MNKIGENFTWDFGDQRTMTTEEKLSILKSLPVRLKHEWDVGSYYQNETQEEDYDIIHYGLGIAKKGAKFSKPVREPWQVISVCEEGIWTVRNERYNKAYMNPELCPYEGYTYDSGKRIASFNAELSEYLESWLMGLQRGIIFELPHFELACEIEDDLLKGQKGVTGLESYGFRVIAQDVPIVSFPLSMSSPPTPVSRGYKIYDKENNLAGEIITHRKHFHVYHEYLEEVLNKRIKLIT